MTKQLFRRLVQKMRIDGKNDTQILSGMAHLFPDENYALQRKNRSLKSPPQEGGPPNQREGEAKGMGQDFQEVEKKDHGEQ